MKYHEQFEGCGEKALTFGANAMVLGAIAFGSYCAYKSTGYLYSGLENYFLQEGGAAHDLGMAAISALSAYGAYDTLSKFTANSEQ